MKLNLGNDLFLGNDNKVIVIETKDYYDQVPDILRRLMKNDLSTFKVVTDEAYYKGLAFMAPKYNLQSARVNTILDMLNTDETLLILSIQLYSPTLIDKVKESNKHYLLAIKDNKD